MTALFAGAWALRIPAALVLAGAVGCAGPRAPRFEPARLPVIPPK